MKTGQQKQVRRFLIEEFGKGRGNTLFDRQDKLLGSIINNTKNKSKMQMAVLVHVILPSIALYKTLSEEDLSEDSVYGCMQKYMVEKVGRKMHSAMARMEIIPGFYSIYSHAFLKVMRVSDAHESTQNRGKDYFDVTITKCLWHTACEENGCAELCRLFCDADNVTYGGLKKIDFTRTTTLGYGGDCCDFHFVRK